MERGWVWLLEKASAPCASQATKPSLQLWHAEVASGQCKCLGTAKAQAKLATRRRRREAPPLDWIQFGLGRWTLFGARWLVCVCVCFAKALCWKH